MIKIILVPVDGSERAAAVLDTAYIIAGRFDAHVKVVHIRERSSEPYLFAEMPQAFRKQYEEMASTAVDTVADKVREQFDAFVAKSGVTVVDKPGAGGGVTASLEILKGDPGAVLNHEARLVDVILMSRPTRHRVGGLGVGERLESLLFQSGRPVLIVPPDWSAHKVDHAAIGWNDSVEAARALAMTLPWLGQMEKVSVLVSKRREAQGDEVIEYLGYHGVEAGKQILSGKPDDVGKQLLATCNDIGAEFLVVGGFSHTRTRQRFFGGVTSHLLGNTDIITVLAH